MISSIAAISSRSMLSFQRPGSANRIAFPGPFS